MRTLNKIAVLAVALAAAWSATSVVAATLPPLGYQVMCLKYPDRCKAGGAPTLVVTDTIMATLKRVNSRVNTSIRPQRERPGVDVWSVDVSVGDCEDYAMTKRQHLIQNGLPPSALRIAYVKTRRGEDHAVLVIHTDRGDLVLDNLAPLIKPLSQSGLRLISIATADPLRWS